MWNCSESIDRVLVTIGENPTKLIYVRNGRVWHAKTKNIWCLYKYYAHLCRRLETKCANSANERVLQNCQSNTSSSTINCHYPVSVHHSRHLPSAIFEHIDNLCSEPTIASIQQHSFNAVQWVENQKKANKSPFFLKLSIHLPKDCMFRTP